METLSVCTGLTEKKRSLVALVSKSWTAALRGRVTDGDLGDGGEGVGQSVIITLGVGALHERDEAQLLRDCDAGWVMRGVPETSEPMLD